MGGLWQDAYLEFKIFLISVVSGGDAKAGTFGSNLLDYFLIFSNASTITKHTSRARSSQSERQGQKIKLHI